MSPCHASRRACVRARLGAREREGRLRFVRFQAAEAGPRGIHTGVFGLVNMLAKQGHLTEDE
jgi:hypothetical protein